MKPLTYVALLRGINVGGNALVSMQHLKEAFASLGLANVKTVLASGNVVFETAQLDRVILTQKIEQKLQSEFGLHMLVILRSREEIQALVASKPFRNVSMTRQTRLHVSFLPTGLEQGLKISQGLNRPEFKVRRASQGEICSSVEVSPQCGTTDLMKELEKQFGKNITTRTWNTVERIAKLLAIS